MSLTFCAILFGRLDSCEYSMPESFFAGLTLSARNELKEMNVNLGQLVDSPMSLPAWNTTLTISRAFFNFGESTCNWLFVLKSYSSGPSNCPLGCRPVCQGLYSSPHTHQSPLIPCTNKWQTHVQIPHSYIRPVQGTNNIG